ncbi:MAG: Type 1 glutamine amidotransferase-like domain-containing protein [Gammaproteobacteria bacterium]
MGGGGFSMEPDNPALDLYVLERARRTNPSVCFIATASGDAETYIDAFYTAFRKLPCRPAHLPLFARTPDLKTMIPEQDVIYVGGGNTKSMLAVWREWGLPDLLRSAWESGTVLAGVSAGAICWFESGLTDSSGTGLYPLSCLGFLPGACCPHYDGEAERRPALRRLIEQGAIANTLALDDGAAAHFVNARLANVVSSRPHAHAYRVERVDGRAMETSLNPED